MYVRAELLIFRRFEAVCSVVGISAVRSVSRFEISDCYVIPISEILCFEERLAFDYMFSLLVFMVGIFLVEKYFLTFSQNLVL